MSTRYIEDEGSSGHRKAVLGSTALIFILLSADVIQPKLLGVTLSENWLWFYLAVGHLYFWVMWKVTRASDGNIITHDMQELNSGMAGGSAPQVHGRFPIQNCRDLVEHVKKYSGKGNTLSQALTAPMQYIFIRRLPDCAFLLGVVGLVCSQMRCV